MTLGPCVLAPNGLKRPHASDSVPGAFRIADVMARKEMFSITLFKTPPDFLNTVRTIPITHGTSLVLHGSIHVLYALQVSLPVNWRSHVHGRARNERGRIHNSTRIKARDFRQDGHYSMMLEQSNLSRALAIHCLLYTSDAADDTPCVDL
eukprot:686336-Amphidinium_carterae.1